MLIWLLRQKLNIWLKLLAHSSSFTHFAHQLLCSGPNKLVGIVGLDRLSIIGNGLVAAFVIIAITYATAYRSGAQINPAVTIALLVMQKRHHCILRAKY